MAPPPSVLMNRILNRQTSTKSPNPLQRSPRFTSGWSPRGRGGGQSMFVVDPKTLATRLLIRPSTNAFQETNSKLVSLFVWLKHASERWFSHVLLLIALILYACLGGWIFHGIEGGFEDSQNVSKSKLISFQKVFIKNKTSHNFSHLFYFPPLISPKCLLLSQHTLPFTNRFSYLLKITTKISPGACEILGIIFIFYFSFSSQFNF